VHAYEVRPRKDHRGVNLMSDALPFGRLWYGEPGAIENVTARQKHIFALIQSAALHNPRYGEEHTTRTGCRIY
jgi:hypothetical protein